jgi:hypothetical protein
LASGRGRPDLLRRRCVMADLAEENIFRERRDAE